MDWKSIHHRDMQRSEYFLIKESFLCVLGASAVSHPKHFRPEVRSSRNLDEKVAL